MLLKKINKTKLIILLIIILAIVLAIIASGLNSSKTEFKVEIAQIDAKYYIVEQEYQYGVIDTQRKYSNRYNI